MNLLHERLMCTGDTGVEVGVYGNSFGSLGAA